MREEIGDLLFVITNIARHMNVEPEAALKLTNRKFRRRFGYIENKLRERNRKFAETTLDELEELWQEAKKTTSCSQRPNARSRLASPTNYFIVCQRPVKNFFKRALFVR